VVGEHREDPNLILLRGEDGRLYQLDPRAGLPIPIESADRWRLDREMTVDRQRPTSIA
jgi:hypothetical protein